jgi:hypothetical protein
MDMEGHEFDTQFVSSLDCEVMSAASWLREE